MLLRIHPGSVVLPTNRLENCAQ